LFKEITDELKPSALSGSWRYSTIWGKPNAGSCWASTARCTLLSTQVGHRELSGPRSFACDSTVRIQVKKMARSERKTILVIGLEAIMLFLVLTVLMHI
jgi:hypothetical protein